MATVRAASFPRIVRNKRILADYPHLTGIEVDESIRFYQAHRSEIDADLRGEQGGED